MLVILMLVLATGCKETAPSTVNETYKTLSVEKQDYTLNRRFTVKIESQQKVAIRPVVG